VTSATRETTGVPSAKGGTVFTCPSELDTWLRKAPPERRSGMSSIHLRAERHRQR